MVERDVFHKKPKQQYHLSHQRECLYDTQSLKEWELLCESLFIPIERRTLIQKLVEKEVFFY